MKKVLSKKQLEEISNFSNDLDEILDHPRDAVLKTALISRLETLNLPLNFASINKILRIFPDLLQYIDTDMLEDIELVQLADIKGVDITPKITLKTQLFCLCNYLLKHPEGFGRISKSILYNLPFKAIASLVGRRIEVLDAFSEYPFTLRELYKLKELVGVEEMLLRLDPVAFCNHPDFNKIRTPRQVRLALS